MRSPLSSALLVSLVLCPPAGCQGEACTIPTSELSMVAVVTDTPGSVRARVDLAWGDRGRGSTSWSRCDGDAVQINGIDARESERDEGIEYSITLDGATAPRSYTFRIERDHTGDTVEAALTLPPTFEISSPAPGELVPRLQDDVITWDPPVPDAELALTLVEEIGGGVCLRTPMPDHGYKSADGLRIPDTGRWSVPADALRSDEDEDCDAAYVMRRFSHGRYPDDLGEGGYVEGRVVRSVHFVSVP